MKDKYVMLERGKDFTLTALSDHLNMTFGAKKSGTLYTAIDVQKYVTRGHLPIHLGGCVLKEMRDDDLGIKMIKIMDEVHSKFAKPSKSDDNDK